MILGGLGKTAAASLLQPRSLARSEKQAKEPLSATIYHYDTSLLKLIKRHLNSHFALNSVPSAIFKEVVPFCLNSNVLIGSRHLKEGGKHESSFCSLGLYLPTKLKVAHDKKIFLRHHLFVMTLLNFSCFPHVDPYIHTTDKPNVGGVLV